MKITSITVSAQQKVPIPGTEFANYAGFVSVSAELDDADNLAACTKRLQTQADNLLDSYMQGKAEEYRAAERAALEARKASCRVIRVDASEKMAAATEETGSKLLEKYGVKK